MSIRVERDALKAALATVLPAIDKRGLPVLSGVRILPGAERVELCCTSLWQSISTTVDAYCDTDAAVVVPAQLLSRVVASMPAGAVELAEADGALQVSSGETVGALRCFDLSAWSQPVVDGEATTLTFRDVDQLARIVGMASTDEEFPAICGVLLSGRQAMATDSYRGAITQLDADIPGELLVRAETIRTLVKTASGDVTLTVPGNTVVSFGAGPVRWTTTLIEQEYPAAAMTGFADAAPSPHHWSFDVDALTEAIHRTDAISSDEPLQVAVEGGKARLSRSAPDVGEVYDVIPVESNLDETLAFNPAFLADTVTAARAEQITIEVTDRLKPVKVRSDGFFQLLMPIGRSRPKT